MKKQTKTYSLRLDNDFIEDFKNSVKFLPAPIKHNELIKSYMQTIIDLSKTVHSEKGIKEFLFTTNSKGSVLLNADAKFRKIQIGD